MDVKIKIIDAWGKYSNKRKGVAVEIKNKDQEFLWMPTYKELCQIYEYLAIVEGYNKK